MPQVVYKKVLYVDSVVCSRHVMKDGMGTQCYLNWKNSDLIMIFCKDCRLYNLKILPQFFDHIRNVLDWKGELRWTYISIWTEGPSCSSIGNIFEIKICYLEMRNQILGYPCSKVHVLMFLPSFFQNLFYSCLELLSFPLTLNYSVQLKYVTIL